MKVWVIGPGFPLSHKKGAYFVPWAGGPGKEATDCRSLQKLLPAGLQATLPHQEAIPERSCRSPRVGVKRAFQEPLCHPGAQPGQTA